MLRSSHSSRSKHLSTLYRLLPSSVACWLDGSLRTTPWSCTRRMLGKLWKLWLTRGTVKSVDSVVVVWSLTGVESLRVAATQRDRHQLAAPCRPAEEEVPALGVQRHRILDVLMFFLYTVRQKIDIHSHEMVLQVATWKSYWASGDAEHLVALLPAFSSLK